MTIAQLQNRQAFVADHLGDIIDWGKHPQDDGRSGLYRDLDRLQPVPHVGDERVCRSACGRSERLQIAPDGDVHRLGWR
jgi:hypothetical protein